MDDKKTCKTCWWCSKAGYCVEGGKPPVKCKEPCNKYKPIKSIIGK